VSLEERNYVENRSRYKRGVDLGFWVKTTQPLDAHLYDLIERIFTAMDELYDAIPEVES
jgi:hypothetical protein